MAIRVPSSVKFSLEMREPGAGFGKAAITELIKSINHFTALAQLLLRALSRTELQLLLIVPTVRNVSCIADVLSNELIT